MYRRKMFQDGEKKNGLGKNGVGLGEDICKLILLIWVLPASLSLSDYY